VSHRDGSIRMELDELQSLVVPKAGVLGTKGIFSLLANSIEQVRRTLLYA
jgi:hypothetical protein